MEEVKIPRLRHNEMQFVGESTVRICSGQELLTQALQIVIKFLGAFKAARQKEKISQSKSELDRWRDRLVTGMMYHFRSELYYPYVDEELKASTEHIRALYKKYLPTSHLPYKEETAAVDNLIVELEKIGQEVLTEMNLTRWITPLKNANQAFKEADDATIEKEATDSPCATEIVGDLIKALNDLYALVYAHARIGENEEIIITQRKLEELIHSVR